MHPKEDVEHSILLTCPETRKLGMEFFNKK
jgi:hypothetical protein